LLGFLVHRLLVSNWPDMPQEILDLGGAFGYLGALAIVILKGARYSCCGLPDANVAIVISEHWTRIDDAGYSSFTPRN
jgi:hypothetical protein